MSTRKNSFASAKLAFILALLGTASVGNTQQADPAPKPPASAAPALTNTLAMSPASKTSAGEIQKINESMTVLSARLAQVELEAKIAAKEKEIGGLNSAPSLKAGPLSGLDGMPSVVSVAGLKGKLEARLAFPSGGFLRVKAGDVIGNRKILSIAINEVVLADVNGKNPQRLAFGSSAQTREASAAMPLPAGPLPMGMPLSGPLSR